MIYFQVSAPPTYYCATKHIKWKDTLLPIQYFSWSMLYTFHSIILPPFWETLRLFYTWQYVSWMHAFCMTLCPTLLQNFYAGFSVPDYSLLLEHHVCGSSLFVCIQSAFPASSRIIFFSCEKLTSLLWNQNLFHHHPLSWSYIRSWNMVLRPCEHNL